jgi:hypothetical protein
MPEPQSLPLVKHPLRLTVIVAGAFACGILPNPTVQAETWSVSRAALHQINLMGTLALDLPLWDYRSPAGLYIPVSLRHDIFISVEGYPESRFVIPQLVTYVTPISSNEWLWCKPGGRKLKFSFEGGRLSAEAGRYLMTRREGGTCTITARDTSTYSYRNFQLKSFTNVAGLTLTVSSNGGLIQKILETYSGKTRELVAVDYAAGRPIRICFDQKDVLLLEYGGVDGAQLERVSANGHDPVYQMSYENALLSSCERTGEKPVHFAWTTNPEFRRGDRQRGSPVWLEADDSFRYAYRIEDIWTIMSATNDHRDKEVMIYNRLTGEFSESGAKVFDNYLGHGNQNSAISQPNNHE